MSGGGIGGAHAERAAAPATGVTARWWREADGAGRRGGRLARALEGLLPLGTRLARGGYFRHGIDRGVCAAIHRAAAQGTLYGFAPPPPLIAVACGRGRWRADEYRFRSPFVSHIPERNDAYLWHYRSGRAGAPLVVLNHGTALFATVIERCFVGRLLAAGIDVAVPVAPGFYRRRSQQPGGRHWASSVGATLSAIVQLVHDNAAVEAWARRGYDTITVTGIGLGGTVAALLAATTARFDAYVAMLAGAHPGRLWLPPRALARAVDRRALARAGLRHARTLVRLFNPAAPGRLPPPRGARACTVVGLRGDTLVLPADVQALARHWGVAPLWLARSRVELPLCAADLVGIVAAATRAAR